jgi:cytochrome c peroxidase
MTMAAACKRDEPEVTPAPGPVGTPYTLQIPANLPPMSIPADNPMTMEGVTLGRFLFYEERLSANNTQSCGSCHSPAFAFTDSSRTVSTGIDGIAGARMALINLGYAASFFWDGRAPSLEDQAFQPVTNPIEMHETWPNAVSKLQADPAYVALFNAAFGSTTIDSLKVVKAIAQFERTMISGNSKYDKVVRGEAAFTPDEAAGLTLFQAEGRSFCPAVVLLWARAAPIASTATPMPRGCSLMSSSATTRCKQSRTPTLVAVPSRTIRRTSVASKCPRCATSCSRRPTCTMAVSPPSTR